MLHKITARCQGALMPIFSCAENLKFRGWGLKLNFCKMCFLQCVINVAKPTLEMEHGQSYLNILRKRKRGLIMTSFNGNNSLRTTYLHSWDNRSAVVDSELSST